MASNFIQPGDTVTLTAPYDVDSGDGVLVGAIFGVAQGDAAETESVEAKRTGIWTLPKTSAQAWTLGQRIYWDDTQKECTTTASGNTPVGAAAAVAANPSATGRVLLIPDADPTAATVADNVPELTENSSTIGGTNDGNLPSLTATAVALDNVIVASADAQQDVESTTVADGTMTGTANGTLELVGATNSGDVSGAIMNNFKDVQAALAVAQANDATIAVAVNQLVTDNVALRAAIREVADKLNDLIAELVDAGQMEAP